MKKLSSTTVDNMFLEQQISFTMISEGSYDSNEDWRNHAENSAVPSQG